MDLVDVVVVFKALHAGKNFSIKNFEISQCFTQISRTPEQILGLFVLI